MYTSSCKFIIADQLRKESTCSICLNYFADLYLTLYTCNFCFFCISTWRKREPDWAFHFSPVVFIFFYIPEDSDHYGPKGSWQLTSIVTTVLSMHHCWLKFYMFLNPGWANWGPRCGYVQQLIRQCWEILGFLCNWMPRASFHSAAIG